MREHSAHEATAVRDGVEDVALTVWTACSQRSPARHHTVSAANKLSEGPCKTGQGKIGRHVTYTAVLTCTRTVYSMTDCRVRRHVQLSTVYRGTGMGHRPNARYSMISCVLYCVQSSWSTQLLS